jgi:hypothetical protein
MKISANSIVKLCILIFLISGYGMLYLVYIPGITHNDFRITFILGVFVTLFFLKDKSKGWNAVSYGFKLYFILSTISILILAIYTIIRYPEQSLLLTLRVVAQYLLVIWTIPLFSFMNNKNSDYALLAVINALSVLWCVLILTQSLVFTITGREMFRFIQAMTTGVRDERLRITTGPFADFSLLYSFWRFYVRRDNHKLCYFGCFIVLFASNVIVSQSRAQLVAVVISLCVLALLDKNRGYRVLRKVFFVAIILLFFVFTSYVQNYLQSIFTRYSISVTSRLYGYQYYWSVFLENPMFGFGLLKMQTYNKILRGSLGIASMDDVGMVGQLAVLGVFSFIIVIGAYIHLAKLILIAKSKNCRETGFMIGIYVYLLFTSFTLIIFDQQRICLLPVIISLFEYYSTYRRLPDKS